MSATHALRVPPTFFEDHLDRCGLEPESSIVRKTKTYWLVELVAADVADLYSDAVHYHESGVQAYGPESLGLISSARATRNGLVKQLGAELLNNIVAVVRAAANAARAAEQARNEADPVWCAERDAKIAAEEERKATAELLARTNPIVKYINTRATLTLRHGEVYRILSHGWNALTVVRQEVPVGPDSWAKARELRFPLKPNGEPNSFARILDVEGVEAYHHPAD